MATSSSDSPTERNSDSDSFRKKAASSSEHFSEKPIDQRSIKPTLYPVSIHQLSHPPTIATGLSDLHGNAVTVACSTCHTTRKPNYQNKTPKDLDEFHGNMPFLHGNISCLSCHNDRDYDALKLADGSRVEFTEVMRLCAQCHGPQMTAYEHGAHGGMTGYWDLGQGPQVKNNCVDCHDPHSPQFPPMYPTFKSKDRFLHQKRTDH